VLRHKLILIKDFFYAVTIAFLTFLLKTRNTISNYLNFLTLLNKDTKKIAISNILTNIIVHPQPLIIEYLCLFLIKLSYEYFQFYSRI